MNPPLFLRFLNLLMNDAIFLLDEAIQVGLRVRTPPPLALGRGVRTKSSKGAFSRCSTKRAGGAARRSARW